MDSEYKDFDMSGATRGIPPQIARLQAKNRDQKQQNDNTLNGFFDSDVRQIIQEHNTPQDRIRLNAVIRALYATA